MPPQGGRAAWNVVTSCNDVEAHNMGPELHIVHDARYHRADESRARSSGKYRQAAQPSPANGVPILHPNIRGPRYYH
jgi:hypothetical protein